MACRARSGLLQKLAMSHGRQASMAGIARAAATGHPFGVQKAGQTSMLPFPPARRLFSSSLHHSEQAKGDPSASSPASSAEPATAKAEKTRRRFWKKVGVAYSEGPPAAHLLVQLDGRSLKTPSGAILAIPTDRPLLASLIAREWAEQDRILRTHSLPMTSLAARAIDGLETHAQREAVVDDLIAYLHTETICFHEQQPPNLVKLQHERWDPILAWTKKRFGTPDIKIFDDIFDVQQDEEVVRILRAHVIGYNGWDLAALERIVRSTKSFLIGVRLVEAIRSGPEGEALFGVHDAALAAEVEVESQTQRWGEVDDTHDVDHADVRKILGSAACALVRDSDKVAREVAQESIQTR